MVWPFSGIDTRRLGFSTEIASISAICLASSQLALVSATTSMPIASKDSFKPTNCWLAQSSPIHPIEMATVKLPAFTFASCSSVSIRSAAGKPGSPPWPSDTTMPVRSSTFASSIVFSDGALYQSGCSISAAISASAAQGSMATDRASAIFLKFICFICLSSSFRCDAPKSAGASGSYRLRSVACSGRCGAVQHEFAQGLGQTLGCFQRKAVAAFLKDFRPFNAG